MKKRSNKKQIFFSKNQSVSSTKNSFFPKNHKGQVWIETVVYTLIAFVMIGLVLAYAKPKIEEVQDQAIIEQSIGILGDINHVLLAIDHCAGNTRLIKLKIKKGVLKIDGINDTIIFEMESRHTYSEPGEEYQEGNIVVTTEKKGKLNIVTLTSDYGDEYDITYRGADELKLISKSATLFNLLISNKGRVEGKTLIDIQIMGADGEVYEECIHEPIATTCGTWVCGGKINNCGQEVNCGECGVGDVCESGSCVQDIFKSCKAILDAGQSTGDKLYTIDPDGVGGADAFEVYCDMTTDGGGWTRVANVRADIPLCAYNVAQGTNTDILTDTSTTGLIGPSIINAFTNSNKVEGVLVMLDDGNYYIYKSSNSGFTWNNIAVMYSLQIETYNVEGSKNGGVYTALTNQGCSSPGCLFGGRDATLGGWSTLIGIGGHARGVAIQDAECLSGSTTWKGFYSGLVGDVQSWGRTGKVYVRES